MPLFLPRFAKFLILFVFAATPSSVIYAADNDKAATVHAAGDSSASKAVTVKDGVWVGVIEDIQDIEGTKQAEFEEKWKVPTDKWAVDLFIGVAVALASGDTGILTTIGDWGTANRFNGNVPRAYLISFKAEDGSLYRVAVKRINIWNVGDKIQVTRQGSEVAIRTLEMGEISRYAAEMAAERDGK